METCKTCGRKLTNPKYIKLGFGKTCYNKHLEEMEKQEEKMLEEKGLRRSDS